jgi:hypothetical protein
MKATITVYLDKSPELSKEGFESIIKVLVDVAGLSPAIENVDYLIEEN